MKEICQHFLGIDPAKQWIPVRPAQHYSMGGIRTNAHGHARGLSGLFSCGEAACWDLHGFNRLGGNSVAETVVAGMIVGEAIADFCATPEGEMHVSTALVRDCWEKECANFTALAENRGSESASQLLQRMQAIMTEKVGIVRNSSDLTAAVDELQVLILRSRNIGISNRSQLGANPELTTAWRLQKMLKLALCVAYGALQRCESRGAHFREDYPQRNDAEWLQRTLAFWPDAEQTLPTLSYETLSITSMELPPGWRGYGARNAIEHPATALRQAEIEQIKTQLGAVDRHTLQAALMPFHHLLPTHLRGGNTRLEDQA